jgi:hypothetical protein
MARQTYFPRFSGMPEALLGGRRQAKRIRFEEATMQMTWITEEQGYESFD